LSLALQETPEIFFNQELQALDAKGNPCGQKTPLWVDLLSRINLHEGNVGRNGGQERYAGVTAKNIRDQIRTTYYLNNPDEFDKHIAIYQQLILDSSPRSGV
jgi:hypothetical protein